MPVTSSGDQKSRLQKLILSYRQLKTQKYSVYSDIKQRKSAILHIWETGAAQYLAILLDKRPIKDQ